MDERRPQEPPALYRFVRDADGQSETFGILLLLAVTVVGTTAIVAFGSQALTETEQASQLQRTEHTMTLLDSRSAMVALGDSQQQSVDFSGSREGSFEVHEDAGWIRITHVNYTGKELGEEEVLYNRSLGKLVYQNGDTEIAYQGGGVWRASDDGTARMISKPEFHYRGSTLTLPVIRMNGTGQAAGQSTVTVSSDGEARRIYPNESMTTDGDEYGAPYNETTGTPRPYANPIRNGTVNVTIHSEYYMGWAEFFRTRTDAKVTTYDGNQTVHMQLLTLSDIGDFNTLTNSLEVGGFPEAHSITDFELTLKAEKNNWNKVHWSFYAKEAGQKFEIHISPNSNKCSDLKSGGGGDLAVSVFYENASSDQSQEWVNNSVSQDDGDFLTSVDCSADELTVNLTATNTILTYASIKGNANGFSCGNNKWRYSDDYSDCSSNPSLGTALFDQHDEDAARSATPYEPTAGDEENVSFVINHYFALMGPSFELKGTDGPGSSDTIDEDESYGTLSYDQEGSKFLTYLHVTENDVEVEVT